MKIRYYPAPLYAACLLIILYSCKSKSVTNTFKSNYNAIPADSSEKVIAGYSRNKKDFSTLKIKAGISYKNENDSYSASADIRIKKGEKILISISHYIPIFKILITPGQFSFYNILQQTYFTGDCAAISRLLGTELTFQQIENILLGEPIDRFRQGVYKFSIEAILYKLESVAENGSNKEFWLNKDYLLVRQHVHNPGPNSYSCNMVYSNYNYYSEGIFPNTITIETVQKENISIGVTYTSFRFNEDFTFPYNIPEHYTPITIE